MKNKILFILLFFFGLFYSYKSQNKNQLNQDKMEVIYEKQIGDFSIQFVRNSDKIKVTWETLYIKNKNKRTIFNDRIEKNIGWKFQEERSENPIDLYNIAGIYYDNYNQSLYIIYNRFGEIILHKYILKNDNFIKDEEKILAKYLMSGGFGKVINNSDIIKIKDKIYFTLTIGQSGIKNPSQMYVFNDNTLSSINKIEFDNPLRIIKTAYINEFGILLYNQDNDNKNEYLNILKNNKEKKYFFIEMPVDENQYKIKVSELHDYGISNFNLFLNEYSENLDPVDSNKIKNASIYINEITRNNRQKFIDYLYDNNQENNLYFFIEDDNVLKIIKFNNYTSDWLFMNYNQKNIK